MCAKEQTEGEVDRRRGTVAHTCGVKCDMEIELIKKEYRDDEDSSSQTKNLRVCGSEAQRSGARKACTTNQPASKQAQRTKPISLQAEDMYVVDDGGCGRLCKCGCA
jgi:hypothetical protein